MARSQANVQSWPIDQDTIDQMRQWAFDIGEHPTTEVEVADIVYRRHRFGFEGWFTGNRRGQERA